MYAYKTSTAQRGYQSKYYRDKKQHIRFRMAMRRLAQGHRLMPRTEQQLRQWLRDQGKPDDLREYYSSSWDHSSSF